MLRFSTAGESHGESLVALVSGLPAGVPVDQEFISRELWRRQKGYGRGGRMRIERDAAHILSGVRHGKTIGSPIAMTIANNDWKNWTEILPVEEGDPAKHKAVASPAPRPCRPRRRPQVQLSRRSLRPRTRQRPRVRRPRRLRCPRQAAAACARRRGRSRHVIRVGKAELSRPAKWDEIVALSQKDEVLLNCVDPEDEARMKAEVDAVLRTGDTVGGVFEVVVHGLPPGIGTHVNWDERLDGLLAQAVMSLQAVKAVEIGRGVTAAESFGSTVHDAIAYEGSRRSTSPNSPASTTTPAASKAASQTARTSSCADTSSPSPPCAARLARVSFETREPVKAAYERSDVCVVPAAGVAAEAMVALAVARLVLEKFGGDSLARD